MRAFAFRFGAFGHRFGKSRLLALSLCAVLVAGCSGGGSGGSGSGGSTVSQFFRASSAQSDTIDPALLRADAPCPQVRVQPRTESLRRDDGSGSASALKYQASITKTARECRPVDGGTAMRVGVAGRLIEGPAGAPASLQLPVRVAVVMPDGSTPYSRLHNVGVSRTGPSQDWAFVDEEIIVADPRRAEIVVGFDG